MFICYINLRIDITILVYTLIYFNKYHVAIDSSSSCNLLSLKSYSNQLLFSTCIMENSRRVVANLYTFPLSNHSCKHVDVWSQSCRSNLVSSWSIFFTYWFYIFHVMIFLLLSHRYLHQSTIALYFMTMSWSPKAHVVVRKYIAISRSDYITYLQPLRLISLVFVPCIPL